MASQADINSLAGMMMGEGINGNNASLTAVGSAALNRLNAGGYGSDIGSVVSAPGQFVGYSHGAQILASHPDSPAALQAKGIAAGLLDGTIAPTTRAVNFRTAGSSPSDWTNVETIGGNTFQLPAGARPVGPVPLAYANPAPSTPAVDAIKSALVKQAIPAPSGGLGGFFGGLVKAGVAQAQNVQKLAEAPAVQQGAKMAIMGSPQLMSQVMGSPTLRNAAFSALMAQNVAAAPRVVAGNQPGGTHALAVNGTGSAPVTLIASAVQRRADSQMPNPGNQNMDVYRANRAAIGGPIMQSSINQALANGSTLYRLGGGGYGAGGGGVPDSLTSSNF